MRLLFLLLLSLAAPAAEPPALLRQGDEACATGLWDIGALRYEQLLRDSTFAKALKPEVATRLAEAWIRSGQAAKALALLKESYLAAKPETYFWTAQALAASGRLGEAVTALEPALERPELPFRTEAILTRASLQLALDQAPEALLTLKPLTHSADPAAAALARLRQAEILLDQGDPETARPILPATETLAASHRPEAALVRARLALATGKPDEAIPEFAALLEQPEGQSITHYHAAAMGLADALAAQGSPEAAAKSLLAFMGNHADSPLLDLMFERILRWLPSAPKPDDPILAQLADWIPPLTPPPPAILNATEASAVSPWPVVRETPALSPYALHALALALHRIDNPKSQAESRSLLARLWLEYPQHPLAGRAMLQTARWLLEQDQTSQAFAILDHLRSDPAVQGEAEFLKARATYLQNDPTQAIALFDAAAKSLSTKASDAARLNAAIVRLHQGLSLPVTTDGDSPPPTPGTLADLQLEQALAAKSPGEAKTALEAFLVQHPDHPRQIEARLAAAEASLAVHPPDLPTARAQLEAVAAAAPTAADPPPPNRLALVKLRLADLSNDPKETCAAAKTFLDTFATDPAAPEVTLLLGRALYQAGDYNQARMTLAKLAAADPTPSRAQAAWLLAARSASLVPSPQSREEALTLFDKAIAIKAPLAAVASLEKARLMLDLNHVAAATAFLRAWIGELPKDDPLRLPAGMLLGEAVTLAANESLEGLAEALAIYQQLLSHPATDPATRHRLKFLCGQTLEQLPDPKNPGAKRIPEAIEAYYSVLEAATRSQPAEWEWFERCGFSALKLYADAERWQSAIAIAKKIASFNGPRAEEAANQARLLQLKHMVWED